MSPWIQTVVEVLEEVGVEVVDEEAFFVLQRCQTLPNLLLRLQTSEPLPACWPPRMGRQVLKEHIEFDILSNINKIARKLCSNKKIGGQKDLKDQIFKLL